MTKAGGVGDASSFQLSDIKRVLGSQVAQLIELIAREAQEDDLPLYLAGGVVRDLLLGKANLDLDLVVEGDAISFAASLTGLYGGRVQDHKPFGTAKWTLDESTAKTLALALDGILTHLDFVTARSETYAQPAALPLVASADIESDLLRRDFSVNALAIQLSPRAKCGRLLDVCDGKDDLKRGLIRALHDQSFIDDPTRILRALRYARRLGFELEANTAEWMKAALPYLGRVSGQRLSKEIDLILREPLAGDIMLQLQDFDALVNIHPAFRVNPQLPELIASCHKLEPPWAREAIEGQTLRWIVLMNGIGSAEVRGLCERLALTNELRQSITASASLSERINPFEDPAILPSQVARILDEFSDTNLQVGWLLAAERTAVQSKIAAYASDWRNRRPTISGSDLKAMGIAPGPRYRQILDRLRFAWIDGDVRSVEDETALLQKLLDAGD